MTILVQHTLTVTTGGTSQALTLAASVASASAAINANHVVFYSTVDCFIRQGAVGATTALVNGTDQFIPGGVQVRLDVTYGNVVSVISTSAGTVYLTAAA